MSVLVMTAAGEEEDTRAEKDARECGVDTRERGLDEENGAVPAPSGRAERADGSKPIPSTVESLHQSIASLAVASPHSPVRSFGLFGLHAGRWDECVSPG